jgi:hypothetical protein
MIVALAGRRIDANDSKTPRFPASNGPLVRERIGAALVKQKASALVCAAACGADLLALEAAGALGIRRRIVLPFDRDTFRKTSVVDRPGEWGTMFDRILEEEDRRGDLVILGLQPGAGAYAAGNDGILQQALDMARQAHRSAMAFVVWEGSPRDSGDVTDNFRMSAMRHRLPIIEITTT